MFKKLSFHQLVRIVRFLFPSHDRACLIGYAPSMKKGTSRAPEHAERDSRSNTGAARPARSIKLSAHPRVGHSTPHHETICICGSHGPLLSDRFVCIDRVCLMHVLLSFTYYVNRYLSIWQKIFRRRREGASSQLKRLFPSASHNPRVRIESLLLPKRCNASCNRAARPAPPRRPCSSACALRRAAVP